MLLMAAAASLAGLWVPASAGRDACASDEATRYRAGGHFGDAHERGRWTLKRNVLTEIVTARTAMADHPGPASETRRYRMAWIGPNRIRLKPSRVAPVELIRCPAH